jgi:hypothetical protein
MSRFKMDENAARDWLISAIVSREMEEFDSGIASSRLPPIGLAWIPIAVGEEDTPSLLIRAAQEAGVLSCPPDMELRFELADDGDEGVYRFLLDVTAPAMLTVASRGKNMRELAPNEVIGLEAAIRILREATEVGNLLCRELWHSSLPRLMVRGPVVSTPETAGKRMRAG